MYLPSSIYNILRCGGFLVKYTDGSGLTVKYDHWNIKTQRSVAMKPKDIKIGEPGFVYTKVWKDWGVHTKEVMLPKGGLKDIVINTTLLGYLENILFNMHRNPQDEAMKVTKEKVKTMKHFEGEKTIYRKVNGEWVEKKIGTTTIPTYLGLSVKTLTYSIYCNDTKFDIEKVLYNEFGFITTPASKKTFAPNKVPRGYKFKGLYNDGYVDANKKYADSETYSIKGTNHSVVADPAISDELLPAHNKLAKKLYQYARETDLSGLRGMQSIGADDYLLYYKRLELAAVRNVAHYDEEDTSATWWTMSEQMIDYWYYQRKTTELMYRATKQLVVPVDAGVGEGWGFTDTEQVGHSEVFDRAVKLNVDAPKDTSILNLLRAIVPGIIDEGYISALLGGYKYTTKESDYNTGMQSRVFGKVDGVLKWKINKSIYKVPRAKALGFKPVKRTVRGVTREYVNLKDIGLTKGNEFVCLDETRGRGFSDFKQLWIMYKIYLLLQPDLRKLTKEQKTLLNVSGIDGKTATKLREKLQARAVSVEDLKEPYRAIGGLPEFMPRDSEIKAAIKHLTRLPTTIKMLSKMPITTKFPTTMVQMFNMVHTGTRLAVGDKVDTEFVGTPRPRSEGLRCIVPDRDLTYWDGSQPIYVKEITKPPVSDKVSRKPHRFNVNPVTYLELRDATSTLEHQRWETVIPFPRQPVVKTTSIKWIYIDNLFDATDIEDSIREVAKSIYKLAGKLGITISRELDGYQDVQAALGYPKEKQLADWKVWHKHIVESLENRRGDL